MFPHYIYQNIDILAVMTVQKNNFGFHSNRKAQGQKHQWNNLYFKYQVCQMKLRHLNTFLQFRLSFHEPHCRKMKNQTISELEIVCFSFFLVSLYIFILDKKNCKKYHSDPLKLHSL